MRRATLVGAVVAAGLGLASADAQAARMTIGSDLAAPATGVRSDPNDIIFWPATAPPGGTIEVPVKGQAIVMRLKGGSLQPQGGPSDPGQQSTYDMIHFVVLRPQSDGTWRTTSTSVPYHAPVMGKNADENSVTTYTSVYPLCVEPGDRIGFTEVGGFDRVFPKGLPYQVFGSAPGLVMSEFRAGGQIDENKTVVRADRVPDFELLLQIVIGTGASARPTCGGSAPSGSDPGLGPEPSDPKPRPGPGSSGRPASATVPKVSRPLKLRRGAVKVVVRCAAAARCAGLLQLRDHGKLVGGTRYSMPADSRHGVTVKLTKDGVRRVRKARRLRVIARVSAGSRKTIRNLTIAR